MTASFSSTATEAGSTLEREKADAAREAVRSAEGAGGSSPGAFPRALLGGRRGGVNEGGALVELGEDAAVAPRPVLRASLALGSSAWNELRGRALLAAAVAVLAKAARGGLADHIYRTQVSLQEA